MNRKQRRALTKRKQPIRTNHDMTIQLAKARDLKTMAHRIESDRQAQRCLWLSIVAMNEAFGIGKDRIKVWMDKLKENTEEYAQMKRDVDEEYANEKLRLRVSAIFGEKISCLCEDELRGGE